MTIHPFLLQAAPGQDPAGGLFSTVIMFAAIAAIFYFMIFRPQKKRQQEREALVNAIEKGDKVVTSSGIHGTIAQIEETTILLQVAENTKMRFEKASITNVLNKKGEKEAA